MLNRAISLFFLILSSVYANEPFLIVSDIDDTIKITGVESPVRSFGRGVFHSDTFAGMGLFYTFSKNKAVSLGLSLNKPTIYISGSPPMLKNKIERMLVSEGFPLPFETHFKKPFGHEDTFTYKLNVLLKIAQKYNVPFVLIGDNTQVDTEVYLEFKRRFPEKVLAIYIHEFSETNIPSTVTSFITSFDISLYEVLAGRLNLSDAYMVGQHVLAKLKTHPRHVIPRFGVCKSRNETTNLDMGLNLLDREIQDEIIKRCEDIED